MIAGLPKDNRGRAGSKGAWDCFARLGKGCTSTKQMYGAPSRQSQATGSGDFTSEASTQQTLKLLKVAYLLNSKACLEFSTYLDCCVICNLMLHCLLTVQRRAPAEVCSIFSGMQHPVTLDAHAWQLDIIDSDAEHEGRQV